MPLRPNGWWLPAAAALLLWNGSSDPSLFDTGELVAAAWLLGGSHAPGQPLHAMLGHLASLVPMGPIAWRVTAVSVGGALAAAWVAGRLAGAILERLTERRSGVVAAVPDGVALGTLLAPPVLRQAVRPEVYAPALALTAGAFLLLWRWGAREERSAAAPRHAALLAALATALHPPHALAIFAVALLTALVLRPDVFRRPRAMAWPVALAAVGLLVHAYLPVRAAAGAPMWGEPTELAGLLDYVTGRPYQRNLGAGAEGMTGSAFRVFPYLAHVTSYVPLIGLAVLAAVAARARTRRRIALLALVAPAAALVGGLLQPLEIRNPDNVAYLAPAAVWLVAAGGAGIGALSGVPRRAIPAAILLVPLALPPVGLRAAPSVVRADSPALEAMAALLTHTPPPRALVVVETDAPATRWWAARATEGARPDVALLATGLSTSSWHWRTLASHPAFDGRPVRGPGTDVRQAYVRGAVMAARRMVGVASEPARAVGGRGRVAGPYLTVPAGSREVVDGVRTRAMAERLAPHVDRLAAAGPEGDHRAAGNVIRAYQLERVRRLLAREETGRAFAQLARALPHLPADVRARVRDTRGLARQPPPVVYDPTAFMRPPGDVTREAAILLFASGDTEGALTLLRTQMESGDPRALLQLAWIHLDAGRPEVARRAMDEFLRAAPQLSDEAEPLMARLRSAGAP
ncbi:MAG: protein O-mannosyl-transferase family [Myxococcota bacterium]